MTNSPAPARLPQSIPSLRIRRHDVINVLVDDAVKDMEKLRKEATEAATKATQTYVNAVNEAAMKAAEPVLTVFKKVSDGNRAFFSRFRLHFDYEDGREREVKPLPDVLHVEITNGDSRYSADASFNVRVKVTKELSELFNATTQAVRYAHQLHRARTMQSIRADAARTVIRQAIANMPEGEALIELMHSLRRQIEKKSGKHLLLTEPGDILK